MAKHLYIAGVDRWASDYIRGSLEIEQALTFERDIARFKVRGEKPFHGQEVIITDDNLVNKLFAGIIVGVELDEIMPDKTEKIWRVDCDDYSEQLNRRLVVEYYENMTADAIFLDIAQKYCQGFTSTGIMSGAPIVEDIYLDHVPVTEAFTRLCKYTGWHWQVDYNKNLHFFSVEQLGTPAPLVLQPGGNFEKLKHGVDIQELRNRVYVRGGKMLSDIYTYEIKADGVSRIWTLPHKPHELTFEIGGSPVTIGVENIHDEADYDCLMNFHEKYVKLSAQTATPVDGATLTFKYKYDVDVITVVDDLESQQAIAAVQGGDGVYEHVIVDTSLTSIDAAEAAAMQDIKDYGNPEVRGSFETTINGWEPGQFVTIQLSDRGVEGEYLIRRVIITPEVMDKWRYRIEYGGRLLGIADYLKALISKQQQTDLAETNILYKFIYGTEKSAISDELAVELRTQPWNVEVGQEIIPKLSGEDILEKDGEYLFLGFDGVDDYVEISDNTSLDLTTALTVEAWIYVIKDPAIVRHISIYEKVNTDTDAAYMMYAGYSVEIAGKRTFRPHIRTVGNVWRYGSIDFDFALNTWYHVAYTYDSATGVMKGYINGIEYPIVFRREPIAGEEIRTATAPFLIAKDTRGEEWFEGIVDEVRIWNIARTQFDIQRDMNKTLFGNEPGLVAYLPMNEGSGNIVYDKTVNGNDGIINGATWETDFQTGTLTNVVMAETGELELWQPDYYAAFDNDLNLIKNDGTTVSPEAGYVVTMRPNEGKFGGAVAVEEGTTNLITNLSTTSFTTNGTGHIITNENNIITLDLTNWTDATYGYLRFNAGSAVLGVDYSFGIDQISGEQVSYRMGTYSYYDYVVLVSEIGRVTTTKQFSAEGTLFIDIVISPSLAGRVLKFAYPQVEQKPFATSFVDGMRADGKLDYGDISQFIPKNQHTIMMWINGSNGSYGISQDWSMCFSISPAFYLGWTNQNNYRVSWVNADFIQSVIDYTGATFQPNQWYMVGYTFNNGVVKLFLNGQKVAEATTTTTIEYQRTTRETRNLYIGNYYGSSIYQFNGIIDEFLASPKAHTEDEIQTWYNQNLPLKNISGYRVSQAIDLSPVGKLQKATISWDAEAGDKFNDDFSNGLSSNWLDVGGSTVSPYALVDSEATGGKVLRAEGGEVWYFNDTLIPFDPNKLYIIRGKVRQVSDPTSGGKLSYIGVEGIAEDGVTMINTKGNNSHGRQFYIAASARSLTAGLGWTEFIGYLKGYGTYIANANDPNNPSGLPYDTIKYIRPMFILNYNDGNGTADIDYHIIEMPGNITIETSVDGEQTWQQCTNGGIIPNLNEMDDLTGKNLVIKETLDKDVNVVSPKLHELTVDIKSYKMTKVVQLVGEKVKVIPLSQKWTNVEYSISEDNITWSEWAKITDFSQPFNVGAANYIQFRLYENEKIAIKNWSQDTVEAICGSVVLLGV